MLTAYYDLATSPPTYDIVSFLCRIEQERIARGEDRIRIIILPGPEGGFRQDKFWPHDVVGRRHMLEHVAIPMAWMLPRAVVELANKRPIRPEPRSIGYGEKLYGTRVYVDALRAGIRPLRPSVEPERAPKLVTITLREAEHWPERNSNLAAWCDAARLIQARGFDVRIIRDTVKADEPIDGLTTDPLASKDLERRAQLYRAASRNLFVNNGPAWFCMALDAPTTIFKPTTEGLNRTCSAEFFRRCGIVPGGQIPGATPDQRIVWVEDSAHNIAQAF